MIVVDFVAKLMATISRLLSDFFARLYNSRLVAGAKLVARDPNRKFCSYVTDDDNDNDDDDEGPVCYICLDTVCGSTVTELLPCAHNERFHTSCLWNWILENNSVDFKRSGIFKISCPLCRKIKTSQVCNRL